MATSGNTFWTPYKIPPTPDIGSKVWQMPVVNSDPYVLSGKSGSKNNANPSKNTEWDRVPVDHIKKELERIEKLVEDLQEVVKDLQSTVEEIKSAIEEIKSTIAEIQSIIAELQSAISDVESGLSNLRSRINNAETKVFDVCENGIAKQYTLVLGPI